MKLRHRFHWSKQQDFSFPFSIVLFHTLSFCTSIDASFLRMYFFLAIEFIKHSISNEGWSTIYYFHLKIKFSFTRLNLFSSSTPLVLEFPMIVLFWVYSQLCFVEKLPEFTYSSTRKILCWAKSSSVSQVCHLFVLLSMITNLLLLALFLARP